MERWIPYPLLAASLLLMWVLLTQSSSIGQLVLGAAVSLLATWAMTALRPERLAVLALIITATPGTMWIHFDRSRETLFVHVLDLIDREAWIGLIKGRYEALLLEIFDQ